MLNISVPCLELILLSAVVYAALIVILRATGKRQVGQLTPFDPVLLLVLSNSVQNSMNGGDNSLVGGLLSAGTLLALNYRVGYAIFRNKTLEDVVEGRAQVVIDTGRGSEDVMKAPNLTQHELSASLRRAGCTCADEVQAAILENNGSISVVRRAAESGDETGT